MVCESGLAAIKARAGSIAKLVALVAARAASLVDHIPPADPQWRNAKASRPSRQQSARHLQSA